LVEELEDERDAVGKDQVLGHELKLVDVVDLEGRRMTPDIRLSGEQIEMILRLSMYIVHLGQTGCARLDQGFKIRRLTTKFPKLVH
jgi:hypothetical protein